MNFAEYIPKLLYNDALYGILNTHEIELIIDRYIQHKSVTEIAFERGASWTVVASVLDRAERRIIQYADYIGDI